LRVIFSDNCCAPVRITDQAGTARPSAHCWICSSQQNHRGEHGQGRWL